MAETRVETEDASEPPVSLRVDLSELMESLDLEEHALTRGERIQLQDLHSSGGIGEVWRAFDETLGREVAVKRLKEEMGSDAAHRARFYREARITGRLDHPGVVPIYDFVSNDGGSRCYYTMRFLRGQTLRDVARKAHARRSPEGRGLPGAELMALLEHFVSVCRTIAFAHTRRIIHRDLKGDNVIVGDFGEVIVLDWGLAKDLSEASESDELSLVQRSRISSTSMDHTLPGTPLGTPSYMSPEQARGDVEAIDERTDVYGLGAILYELLTGRPPFVGDALDPLLAAVVCDPPVAPATLLPETPPALEALCMRCLAKRPEDRPEGAAAVAQEIVAWIAEQAERKRTLEERERFFDLSTDLMAVVVDGDRIVQRNRAWMDDLGVARDEQSELHLLDWVDSADHELARLQIERAWQGRELAEFELTMRTRAGDRRCYAWKARPIPSEQALYWVGRDVTERKRAQRELTALLEAAPDATCVIDGEGKIVRVNRELERMFELSRDRLIGWEVDPLVPAAFSKGHRDHVARYLEAPTRRAMGSGLELYGQRADGSKFPVEISLNPLEIDGRPFVVCSIRDMSAWRASPDGSA